MRSVPELDDLITQVRRRAEDDEAATRLAEAVRVGNELGARADALVDHFVGEARDAGLSWAQIGACLGVSKQAAQQQFVDVVTGPRGGGAERRSRAGFERFTKRARQTVKGSVRAAQAMGSSYIGTEHQLLALAAVSDGVASKVLSERGAEYDRLRADVIAQLAGPSDEPAATEPVADDPT